MTNLTYQVEIRSDCETVWRALTDPALYRKWATAFSANSQFVGNWVEGEYIDFFDPGFGGTRAVIDDGWYREIVYPLLFALDRGWPYMG